MSAAVPTEFHTDSLFFAAFLLCRRARYRKHSVSFLRIELKPDGRTEVFVFGDPNGEIPELERQFGTNPTGRWLTAQNAYNRLRQMERDRGGAR